MILLLYDQGHTDLLPNSIPPDREDVIVMEASLAQEPTFGNPGIFWLNAAACS